MTVTWMGSIATVAKDVHTSVTGIQAAITFYTLVMASLMITGGRLGEVLDCFSRYAAQVECEAVV
ncbi:MAG: hypothetical protein ACRDNZ_03930 [Streptosporangiaceae bacterium]